MRYEYPAARMRYRGATLRLYQPCGGASVYEPAESHPPYKSPEEGLNIMPSPAPPQHPTHTDIHHRHLPRV